MAEASDLQEQLSPMNVVFVGSPMAGQTWRANAPGAKLMAIGETFSIACPFPMTPSIALTRAPAGNALTVSSLALNGAFAVAGRYTITLTNAGQTRRLDVIVTPANINTTTLLGPDSRGVMAAYVADPIVFGNVADTVWDGLTASAYGCIPAALHGLKRLYGGQ